MRGDRIPKATWIIGKKQEKRPLYTLRSQEEESLYQEKNKDRLSFWYGTNCEKCCGVYPKFYTEQGFNNDGYYVCMVCGKESQHAPMTWMAKDLWNNHKYLFKPEPSFGYQYTLEDLLEGAQ